MQKELAESEGFSASGGSAVPPSAGQAGGEPTSERRAQDSNLQALAGAGFQDRCNSRSASSPKQTTAAIVDPLFRDQSRRLLSGPFCQLSFAQTRAAISVVKVRTEDTEYWPVYQSTIVTAARSPWIPELLPAEADAASPSRKGRAASVPRLSNQVPLSKSLIQMAWRNRPQTFEGRLSPAALLLSSVVLGPKLRATSFRRLVSPRD